MTGSSLLVMVPVRGRRALAERCLQSYMDTVSLDSTEICFISDGDDQATYDGIDWGPAIHAVIDPREYVAGKLNKTAQAVAGTYDVLMHTGDDNVFVTPGWDEIMLAALEDMGGSGWVYPDNKRRNDVPEMWACSADVVEELGWFLPPVLQHYYVDNAVAQLGKRAGMIRYCPDAVIEHRHYTVNKSQRRDRTYSEMEKKFGASDLAAFRAWETDVLPYEVARLRRRFSADVEWVLSRCV